MLGGRFSGRRCFHPQVTINTTALDIRRKGKYFMYTPRYAEPLGRHCILFVIMLACSIYTAQAQIDTWWTNPDGGVWADGANWSSNPDYPNNGPSETYNATIDLAGNPYTVNLNTDITIDNFTLDSTVATLNHSTGTFCVLSTANLLSGTYYLEDGVLTGGTWNVAPGVIDVDGSAHLDGITLNGDIDLVRTSARLWIANGLSLNGTIMLSDLNTGVRFDGGQTLDSGEIRFNPDTYATTLIYVPTSETLTIGSSATISGGRGKVRGNGALVNQGLISSDSAGLPVYVGPTSFTNMGVTEAINGGILHLGWDGSHEYAWTNASGGLISATDSTLDLRGQWSNAGLIQAVNSTVNLGGTFTTTGLGTIERTGGTINLTGELDNTGSALNFNAASGSWWLTGGTIIGGELNFADGERLRLDLGVLDDVTVNGTLDFSDEQATVVIRNGTTFQGDVTLGTGDQLIFEDWPSLDDKLIHMERGSLVFERDETTLGAQLCISGPAGYIYGREGNVLTNLGTITAVGASSYEFRVGGDSFINENLVEASDDGMLNLYAEEWTNSAGGLIRATDAEVLVYRSSLPMSFQNYGTIDATRSELSLQATWTNAGVINAVDSIINLGGDFATADIGTINRTGGTVNITGHLDNTNDTLLLDATTGSWNLAGGSITGGTVQFADGQRLELTDNTHSLLDAVNLESGLDFSSFEAVVTLANGTIFEGDVNLTGAGSRLILQTGQTFDNKTVTFASPDRYTESFQPEGADTLIIGPNVLIHGGGGEIWPFTHGPHDSPYVINQGIISADMPGESISVKYGVFGMTIDNQGTFEARNGGTLNISHAQIMANFADNTLTGGN
ncbi:MAG: hypothetical protein ABIG44_03880 [Planctomycetota bacterium]